MPRKGSSFFLVVATVVAFAVSSIEQAAYASVIGTQQYLSSVDRQQTLERIDAVLAREDVQRQLEQLGVDPSEAAARVDALTDQELQTLADRLDELPAGGSLLGIVGIVFIVLLILELVGAIDIFKKI
ncbi:MAG TPA: PA2779 family protein [Gammaproteobacteria bacterium]|nr:PA2779 family protein [Gammaproteobacteria bacterium]